MRPTVKRNHKNLTTISVLMGVLASPTAFTGCGGAKSGSDATAGSGANMSDSPAGGHDASGGATGGGAGQGGAGTTASSTGIASGGTSQSSGGRDGSGGTVSPKGGSTTAAGGSSATTSSSTAAAGPSCRTYATAYTFESSLGAKYKYACGHTETANGFDRMCKQSTTTDTEHWASKSDFIEEAAAVGITKVINNTRDYPSFQTTYNYDAQGRLTTILTGATPHETYDQWDELKRPLHGLLGPSCENAESTHSYTDRTSSVNTTTGVCAQHLTMTFDTDGILTFVDYGNGTTATYTTTARATVCR
jgi:hypothetical protein